MQQCDFEYEILIHDDASTDGTDNIIREYQIKFPGIIKPVYQTENQYSKGAEGIMAWFNSQQTKGKYIALCEGDDYWTDPLKLQKQVDLLEAHNNINVCFHSVAYVDAHGQSLPCTKYTFDKEKSQFLSFETILENWGINTCSVLFRNPYEKLPSSVLKHIIGDQPLVYFLNLGKNFYYFSDIMACYRVIDSGITGTFLKNELKSDIEFPFLDEINELSKEKYSQIIQRRKTRTIIRDLQFLKNTRNATFFNRLQFYLKNFFYLFTGKNGIKVSITGFFKYVL